MVPTLCRWKKILNDLNHQIVGRPGVLATFLGADEHSGVSVPTQLHGRVMKLGGLKDVLASEEGLALRGRML